VHSDITRAASQLNARVVRRTYSRVTRASKKTRERRFLDDWRRVEGSFPYGEIRDHERPDFLVVTSDHQVGIELTELLIPSDGEPSQVARENFQEQVVDLGARMHADLGGPALDVAVYFGLGTPVTKQTYREVARALVDVVRDNTAVTGLSEWKNDSLVHPQLTHVRIFRSEALTTPTWHVWYNGWVPDAEPNWIQNAIDKKASLRSKELSLDQIWLLIVSEGFRVSSVALFGSSVIEGIYNSPFGRTFLFDRMGKRSIELHTHVPPQRGA
jgi:hypothetical protein